MDAGRQAAGGDAARSAVLGRTQIRSKKHSLQNSVGMLVRFSESHPGSIIIKHYRSQLTVIEQILLSNVFSQYRYLSWLQFCGFVTREHYGDRACGLLLVWYRVVCKDWRLQS